MTDQEKERFVSLCNENSFDVTSEIFEYLFEDEKTRAFLNWYCDSFNSSNILKPHELKEIKCSKCYLSADDIEKISNELKNMRDLCDGDVSASPAELEELRHLLGVDCDDGSYRDEDGDVESYEKLLQGAEMYNDSLIDAIRILEEEHCLMDEKLAQDEKQTQLAHLRMCEESSAVAKLGEKLDDAHKNLWENLKKVKDTLGACCASPSKPQMFYQLPLSDFASNLEEFECDMEKILDVMADVARKEIVPEDGRDQWILTSLDKSVRGPAEREKLTVKVIWNTLEIMKIRYTRAWNEYLPLLERMEEIEAVQSLLEEIEKEEVNFVSGDDLRKHLEKYEKKVNIIEEKLSKASVGWIERRVGMQMLDVWGDVSRHKLYVWDSWVEAAGKVTEHLKCLMFLGELLLRLERNETVSPSLMDFLEVARTYFVNNRNEFLYRMERMRNLREQHESQTPERHPILEMCGKLLLPDNSWEDGVSNDQLNILVKAKDSLVKDVSKMEVNLLRSVNAWSTSLVNNSNSVLRSLKSRVYTGPTAQPEIFQYGVLTKLHQVKDSINDLDKLFKQLKTELKKEYSSIVKSPSQRAQKLLWIRFLADERTHQKMNASVMEETKSSGDSDEQSLGVEHLTLSYFTSSSGS